ncbi:MAG: hypothetical protein ABFS22_03590 [Pseudomonadota bacterium]
MNTRTDLHTDTTGSLPAIALSLLCCLAPAAMAADDDPHYTGAGFFDIHVCNWPDRSPFLMPLFSTARYNEVQTIEVLTPEGDRLVELNLDRYRTIKRDKLPDKRVFIKQIDIPPEATNGWYEARITLKNNEQFIARDYMIRHRLPQAAGQIPAHEEQVMEIPTRLTWEPVPGAGFYQVFIRDRWDDDRLIHTSELLTRPDLEVPPGLLKKGGYYSWIIHARDTNSHILLGDFNHGSLNKPVTFSVSE